MNEEDLGFEEDFEADYLLAQRCVAGEVAAWEELYAQCHDPLMTSIQELLNGCSNDVNLAEEIAARVWYALVANDAALLSKYDHARGGRLITFMRALAKDLFRRHIRSERRRAEREFEVSQEKPDYYCAEFDRADSFLDDFLGTLDAKEREFFCDYLLEHPAEAAKGSNGKMSEANIWQMTRRAYKQFLNFFFVGRRS